MPQYRKAETSSAELFNLLLGFCRQIAEGLAYLSDKAFVHRDIAARNVLLDKELNCKVNLPSVQPHVCSSTYT